MFTEKDVTSVSDIVFKTRVTHAYLPTQPTGAPLRWIAPSPGETMTYFNTTLHIFLELGNYNELSSVFIHTFCQTNTLGRDPMMFSVKRAVCCCMLLNCR